MGKSYLYLKLVEKINAILKEANLFDEQKVDIPESSEFDKLQEENDTLKDQLANTLAELNETKNDLMFYRWTCDINSRMRHLVW